MKSAPSTFYSRLATASLLAILGTAQPPPSHHVFQGDTVENIITFPTGATELPVNVHSIPSDPPATA